MAWKFRGEEHEAVMAFFIVVCVAAFLFSAASLEHLCQKPVDQAKREKLEDAAMIQLRWESSAKANKEVRHGLR